MYGRFFDYITSLYPRHTRRRSHYALTTFVERGGNVLNAVEAQFDLIAIAVDRGAVTMSVERVAKF